MNLSKTDFKRTFILTVIIFVVIQLLNVILGNQLQLNSKLLIGFGFTALYTFSLSYANSLLFRYLDKIFQDNRFSVTRIIVGFIAVSYTHLDVYKRQLWFIG